MKDPPLTSGVVRCKVSRAVGERSPPVPVEKLSRLDKIWLVEYY